MIKGDAESLDYSSYRGYREYIYIYIHIRTYIYTYMYICRVLGLGLVGLVGDKGICYTGII